MNGSAISGGQCEGRGHGGQGSVADSQTRIRRAADGIARAGEHAAALHRTCKSERRRPAVQQQRPWMGFVVKVMGAERRAWRFGLRVFQLTKRGQGWRDAQIIVQRWSWQSVSPWPCPSPQLQCRTGPFTAAGTALQALPYSVVGSLCYSPALVGIRLHRLSSDRVQSTVIPRCDRPSTQVVNGIYWVSELNVAHCFFSTCALRNRRKQIPWLSISAALNTLWNKEVSKYSLFSSCSPCRRHSAHDRTMRCCWCK
jgi:hypothetical protein